MNFTYDDYRELLNNVPFQPFRVVSTSGREFVAHDPALVFIGENYLMIAAPGLSNPKRPGVITRVAFSHVAELETLNPPNAA